MSISKTMRWIDGVLLTANAVSFVWQIGIAAFDQSDIMVHLGVATLNAGVFVALLRTAKLT